jgi:hypothetical protein
MITPPEISKSIITTLRRSRFFQDSECQELINIHLPGIQRAVVEFGPLSRCAYYFKYLLACRLFSASVNRMRRDRTQTSGAMSETFDLVYNDLNCHFQAMRPPTVTTSPGVRRIVVPTKGREIPHYKFDNTHFAPMRENGLRLQSHVITLTRETAKELSGNSTYLYCIDEEGQIIIYNRPLRGQDLLGGVRHSDFMVKHPMLVQERNLTVRCAGDMWLVKDVRDSWIGIFANRSSGQFRPWSDAAESLFEAVRHNLGVVEPGVVFVG